MPFIRNCDILYSKWIIAFVLGDINSTNISEKKLIQTLNNNNISILIIGYNLTNAQRFQYKSIAQKVKNGYFVDSVDSNELITLLQTINNVQYIDDNIWDFNEEKFLS